MIFYQDNLAPTKGAKACTAGNFFSHWSFMNLLICCFLTLTVFACHHATTEQNEGNEPPAADGKGQEVMKVKTSLNDNRSEDPEITIDMSIRENQAHAYADQLAMFAENCTGCIAATYHRNKGCEENKKGKAKTGDNMLIYTLDYGTYKVNDTLFNCAGIYRKASDRNSNRLSATGSLPSGVYHSLEDFFGRYKFKIGVSKGPVQLKIEIVDASGTTIETIAEENVGNGEYSFVWNTRNTEKGTYDFVVTVDDHKWVQPIGID